MSKAAKAAEVDETFEPDGEIEGEREIGRAELKGIAEALIFVADEPINAKSIADVLKVEREAVETAIAELAKEYERRNGGLQMREIAGGWQIATRPEYHEQIRAYLKSRPSAKLSLASLETLAVIAYKQPVTAPEVSEIRGVDTSGVLGSLISRKLITTAGRKQVIGRPILYKTTKEFLLRFGLKDVNELPSIEEFENMAGELAEADVEQDPHVAAPEELPFFEDAGGSEGASEAEEPMSQGYDMGRAADTVIDTVTISPEDPNTVTDVVSNTGEAAVEADENGFPSETQTVPGGAHESPEDLKEDR